ncbi:MAG: NFACT family protein [Candidatus Nanohaloarchaeota archaeon QJJ-9]|nr:NFACT family protein [Candidatus Nanohaloarchaeota archaeon QJJ-9]
MREKITSLDIRAVKRELKALEGARIDKVYQRGNELTVHVYKPGDKKYRLFIASGKVFITSYKRDNPQRPPGFCMKLRKHLSGKTIERIEQKGFDRVIEIHTDEEKLVAELFGQGNFIHVDKGTNEILSVMHPKEWSDRALYQGEKYKPPKSSTDPSKISLKRFKEFLGGKQIVKVLAADLGLGGIYAEELLERVGIDKEKKSDSLGQREQEKLVKAVKKLIDSIENKKLKPRIYHKEGELLNVSPISLKKFEGLEQEEYSSFSEALDEYFTKKQKQEYRKKKREEYRKKKEELERRKEQQEETINGLEEAIENKKVVGDLIYENYSVIEDLIGTIKKARKQYSDSEIQERLESEKAEGIREAQIIENLKLPNDKVTVDLGEDTAEIDINEKVETNAEKYYKKSKEAKRKVEGAKEALEKTKEKFKELEENKKEIDMGKAFKDKEEKKKKKRWYEKYRWFYSSDGFLVVGGMDKTSNDVLVKKQMEKNDRYVHADFQGAPSVIIKNPEGKEIPEKTLKQAAKLAVTYSKAWEKRIAADDAYHVSPDQVTKEPESGEYLGKGAFVIRGDRNYIRNVGVSSAVGAYKREDQMLAMGGPIEAVKENCEVYVELKQGRKKKSDTAKKIQSYLHEKTGEDFDIDRIMRAMPPGKAKIKNKV